MRGVLRLLVLSALWFSVAQPAFAQKARITMVSSSTRVGVGEPFALEIRADLAGEEVDDIAIPDFGSLEILGRRVSRPTSFSFGFGTGGQHARVQSQIIHSFTLRAVEPGSYTIQPAIMTIGGRKLASPRLTIQVVGTALPQAPNPQGPASDNGAADSIAPPEGTLSGARYDNDLFLRTVVDKPRAYVGEQVTVTVYLYVRGGLTQNPAITREPTTEGFWVQDLLPVQRTLAPVRQQVNGRTFNVYVLRRYAAFPLRDGKLEIGAPAIEVGGGSSLFDLLNGPAAAVRRNGVAVPVEALPLPTKGTQAPTHVGSLTLEASLDPNTAKVGDAVTLRVVAKGTGNLKGLKLPAPTFDGVEVLAPEIDDQLTYDLDQVGGARTFRWLLLPRKPGTFSVPPFEVAAFEPTTRSFANVRSQALSLSVSGEALPTAAAPNTTADVDQTPSTVPEPQKGFGPPRATSELRRARAPLSQAPWFLWAVLAGPLLLTAFAFVRTVGRKVAATRTKTPAQLAFRGAEERLHEATKVAKARDATRAYGHLTAALRAALQARLNEPVGGLTLPLLRNACLASGMAPALVERVVGALTACEQARFDPTLRAAESLDQSVAETAALLSELKKRGT